LKEYPLLFGKERNLVGIVSYNDTFSIEPEEKIGVLLLNAGLIHHVGPSRLYVKLARKLAALGFVVLRYDMSGVGDSQPRNDAAGQEEAILDEARQAMDYLQQHRGVEHFIPIGACAGASAAFLVAESDSRVVAAVLVNPLVPQSDQTAHMRAFSYYSKRAISNRISWFKFFTFRSDFRTISKALSLRIRRMFIPNYMKNTESAVVVDRVKQAFQSFIDRSVNLLIISSENEIGNVYLQEILGDRYFDMKGAGLLKTDLLPETDHNITPLKSQGKVIEILPEWCQLVVTSTGTNVSGSTGARKMSAT
jgi:hypothetical protein